MAEFYFKTRLRVGTVFQILKGSSLSTTVAEAFKHISIEMENSRILRNGKELAGLLSLSLLVT